jgi:hypothetical protein
MQQNILADCAINFFDFINKKSLIRKSKFKLVLFQVDSSCKIISFAKIDFHFIFVIIKKWLLNPVLYVKKNQLKPPFYFVYFCPCRPLLKREEAILS